jgi:peptidylprolyl isomerase
MRRFWSIPRLAVLALCLGGPACDSAKEEGVKEKEVFVRGSKYILKYVDLVEGKGKEVKKGDTVEVHYVGTLKNGKKFDSSRDRGKPFVVSPVGFAKVIDGWNEGLPGMKEGGKRKLILPPQLAYGESGYPPDIPPNAELIFEIEVLKVE